MNYYFDKDKIEAEFPEARMIPPMLAWKLPKHKQNMQHEVMNSGEYFAELKIDGACYTFEYTPSGHTYLFSRTVSRGNGLLVEKSDRVPHIVEQLTKVLRPGSIVALEVFIPKGKAKDVVTIMGCLPAKAIERQKKSGNLKVCVHDILMLEGESMIDKSAIDRIQLVCKLFASSEPDKDVFFAMPIYDDIEEYLTSVWQSGEEGVILKKKNGHYYPGKRPAWSWIKFKTQDDFDVVCIGYLPSTIKYTGSNLENWKYYEEGMPVTKAYANGWIGSIRMGCYKDGELIEIGSVSSGLNEGLLQEIKENPDTFIGRPMLIKAMETTPDFKLREPKFIRFRDDINANDCTFVKIFG